MNKEKNQINFYHQKNIEVIQGKSIHSFPKHSHEAFCIGIVTNGILRLNIEQQEYLLEKNDVYFIPPHIEHTISFVDKIRYEYMVICIHNDDIKIYNNILLYKYVFKAEVIGIKILNIIKYINDEHYFENIVSNLLKQYIDTDYNYKKQINSEIILLASEFIKDNLDETFNLQKLSDYTHITKYHLVRLFKNQMGVAPYQFYMQEKIKQIKKGLLKQQPIANLVFKFNFSDQSHFCNTFKKHIGITPLQFKDSYKNFS